MANPSADADLDDVLDSALDDFLQAEAVPASGTPTAPSASSAANSPYSAEQLERMQQEFADRAKAVLAAGGNGSTEQDSTVSDLASLFATMLQENGPVVDASGNVASEATPAPRVPVTTESSVKKETPAAVSAKPDSADSKDEEILDKDALARNIDEALDMLANQGSQGGAGPSSGPGLGVGNMPDFEDPDQMMQFAKELENLPEFTQAMESMTEALFSKDILYTPMKEFCNDFDPWLEKNAAGLSDSDKKRFQAQRKIAGEICEIFEKDGATSDDSKLNDERLSDVLRLIGEMQEHGDPPAGLVPPLTGGGPGGAAPQMPPECAQQ